jgi:hypothetical protein
MEKSSPLSTRCAKKATTELHRYQYKRNKKMKYSTLCKIDLFIFSSRLVKLIKSELNIEHILCLYNYIKMRVLRDKRYKIDLVVKW